MRGGRFRDALLVVAPCAAVLVGLASIDHRQRLVEAGYRVGALEREREGLASEVEHRRAAVASLGSPARLLGESRERKLGLDYPLKWNRIENDEEARALIASRTAPAPAANPKASKAAAGKKARAKKQGPG